MKRSYGSGLRGSAERGWEAGARGNSARCRSAALSAQESQGAPLCAATVAFRQHSAGTTMREASGDRPRSPVFTPVAANMGRRRLTASRSGRSGSRPSIVYAVGGAVSTPPTASTPSRFAMNALVRSDGSDGEILAGLRAEGWRSLFPASGPRPLLMPSSWTAQSARHGHKGLAIQEFGVMIKTDR